MKALVLGLLTVVAFTYPLFIYFGISHVGPAVFAAVLMFFSVTKLVLARKKAEHRQTVILLGMAIYSGFAAVNNSEWLLRLYPVIMSVSIAGLFVLSYFDSESVIEKMAKMAGQEITPNAKRYTRKLTLVWAGVLLINGMVAFYLAMFASLKTWALYCGLLSYLVFALLFILEFVYRQYYIKKYGA